MKIISFSKEDFEQIEDSETGWIETDDVYRAFRVHKDGKIEYSDEFQVSEYEDYEHFVGVQSKFNPYTRFLSKPIEITMITYGTILKARLIFEG